MVTIEMGGTPDDSTEAIDAVVAGTGVAVIRTADPDAFAIEFTDRLDAELLDSPDDLDAALIELRAAVDARTEALAALEIHARRRTSADEGHHQVTDVDALRRLVDRLHAAEELVEASRRAITDRLGSGTGMAVHPDALRAAAAEVRNERAAVASLDAEILELEAVTPAELPAAESEPAETDTTPETERTWDDGERRTMFRAAIAAALSLVAAAVLLAVSSTFAGFVVPVLLVVWMVVIYRRNQRGLAGYDVARDNLAAVTALTDRAYGGVAETRSPELRELDRRRNEALDRLRYAESRWVGLVGTEVDAESVDGWLATREPTHRIGEGELAQTPSVRAASAQLRRLTAQWKLAWYALDRPVPEVAAAASSLDALSDEGIDRICVPTHERRSTERSGDDDRFSELAAGRSIDDLRAVAALTPRPLVVLDTDGAVPADELEARTQDLPPDVRIIVVRSSAAGSAGGEPS